jgi:hypothetical protein
LYRTLTATILTLTILTTGCSSGPTLTDAQLLWCTDHVSHVVGIGRRLELKDFQDVWFENRGATFDAEGRYTESDKNKELAAEYNSSSESSFSDHWDATISEWFTHPDGIRSCIATYDSR